MRHYHYIDDSIVFKMGDEQIVENEIQEIVDGLYCEDEMGDCHVILSEAQDGPDEPSNMQLNLFGADDGFNMTYVAEHPTLVVEDGKLVHYWDLRLQERSTTDLYEEEDMDSKLDYTWEDIVEAELRKSCE